MKKVAILILVTALAVSSLLASEYDVIAARQGIFEALEDDLNDLDKQENWQESPERWLELAGSVRDMKQLYPEGSRQGSRSRRSVWSKPDDFESRLEGLAQDLESMGHASTVGNGEHFERYRDDVESSCRGCHMRFKTLF